MKPPRPRPSRRPGARGARSRRGRHRACLCGHASALPGRATGARALRARSCVYMHVATPSAANVQDAGMAGGVEVVEARRCRRRRGESLGIALLAFTVIVWGCAGRVTAEATPLRRPDDAHRACARRPTALVAAHRAAAPALPAAVRPRRVEPAPRSAACSWSRGSSTAFTESVTGVGPGIAIVLLSTSPFFIILAEWRLFGQRVTTAMLLGMLVGFGGVILVASGADRRRPATRATWLVGMALAISAAIAWAVGTLIVDEQLTRRTGHRPRRPHGRAVHRRRQRPARPRARHRRDGRRGVGLGHAVARRRVHLDRRLRDRDRRPTSARCAGWTPRGSRRGCSCRRS